MVVLIILELASWHTTFPANSLLKIQRETIMSLSARTWLLSSSLLRQSRPFRDLRYSVFEILLLATLGVTSVSSLLHLVSQQHWKYSPSSRPRSDPSGSFNQATISLSSASYISLMKWQNSLGIFTISYLLTNHELSIAEIIIEHQEHLRIHASPWGGWSLEQWAVPSSIRSSTSWSTRESL